MKNKKLIYLLLPLVLLIWGIIFYRIFSGIKNNPVISQPQVRYKKKVIKGEIKDSFGIVASYRDPFLVYVETETEKPEDLPVKVPPPPIIWPKIEYLGMVKAKKNMKASVILNIDGNEFLTWEGTEIKGVKILKVVKDFIVVRFSDEKKSIKLLSSGREDKGEIGISGR